MHAARPDARGRQSSALHWQWLRPLAVVPLKIKDQVIGLLVIYKLLQQKRAFSPTDYELFSLLAGQAATAIFSMRVNCEGEAATPQRISFRISDSCCSYEVRS